MKSVVHPFAWDGRKTTSIRVLPQTLLKNIFLFINVSFATAVRIFSVLILLVSAGTSIAAIKTSAGSGNWNTNATWSPAGVPANGDDVIIASGHTVTINANTNNLVNLTVNGTLIIGDNNTDRIVTVTGTITISSTGVFNTAGNGGNTINSGGSLVNNGIFDLNTGSATATIVFNGAANQTISGTGGTTDFYTITINNAGSANNNIIEILPSNFTAASGFLTLTKGIIKMSGSYTFSNVFFNTANPTINSDEGIWINNPNVTVTGQNGDTQLSGMIRISAGTYNIGVAADYWLYYNTGAVLTVEGGALNITGAFFGNSSTSAITYTQTNGVVTVCTVGNAYSVASFEIKYTGSIFTMSGGFIILQNPASVSYDYINNAATTTVTGGTVQAGNSATPAGSLFWINNTASFYNLVINGTNNPTTELKATTTIINDLTINGVLDATTTNYNIFLGHDWINNGSFVPRSATVTFNGSSAQQIGGTSPTTFNNFTVNKTAGGITLNKTTSISGAGIFTAGVVTSSPANTLIFNDDATTSGANNGAVPSYVHGPVKKIGNDAFTFPVGKTGAGYRYCAISAPSSTTDAFTAEFMRASATLLGPITASGLYTVSNCEYWKIDRTTGTSNVNVTLSWSGLSNCNAAVYVNSLSSLMVAHFNGTNWNSYGSNSTTGNASSGSVTWNNVSAFSPFSIGSNSIAANPLPVKFSIVKAYAAGVNNTIEWTNETEEGIDRYEIEKSTDGNLFTTINTATPKINNGTKAAYTIIDQLVNNKTSWYRIKAVELNGNSIYSSIVKVSRGAINDMQLIVFPNPVKGNQFGIQLNSRIKNNYTIQIINQSGQNILTKNWQYNGGSESRMITLPSSTAAGIYLIRLSGAGELFHSKIIIQ